MNFNEFVENVQDDIRKMLPEKYENAEIRTEEVQKLNDGYLAMQVLLPGENIAPNLNLDAFFEAYQDGVEYDSILSTIAGYITLPMPEVNIAKLLDYERVKDNLFIRVSNADKNAEVLSTVPNTRIEDLAITYHVLLGKGDDGVCSQMITNHQMDMFGVSMEQLHQDALASSKELFPPEIIKLTTILEESMAKSMRSDGFSEEEIKKALEGMQQFGEEPDLYVITNTERSNGAAVIFQPGIMDEVAQVLGEDFHVLPSSTHEVIIVPESLGMPLYEMNSMIMNINETEVRPEDRLSDEAYHYDSKDKVFEKATSFAERMAAKKKEKSEEKSSVMDKLKEKQKEAVRGVKDAVEPKKTPEVAL